ncbi:MAG: group 1 truncated hemoglobin [Pseudohongiella sp.]|nr:group 1 truncated hemoglobin [Pseudohongiella sp.]
MSAVDKKLQMFEEAGGRAAIEKVTEAFYDKVYADPWLSQFFDGIPRSHIQAQQDDFMQAALGGRRGYSGKTPPSAHQHIYITEEMFEVRQAHLMSAFRECHASERMVEMWLAIEDAFRGRLTKDSMSDCVMRYPAEGIRNYPKPLGY